MPARSYDDLTELPEGFAYVPDLITEQEEGALLREIGRLEFGPVVFRGVTANRRVVHFGHGYEFDSRQLSPGPPIPDFLVALGDRASFRLGLETERFGEVLVTEYQPGAGIGWHRDAPAFGKVVGVSLLADCDLRFQHGTGTARETRRYLVLRRSAYLLDGPARTRWQHSIPAVQAQRYSVTFRTLRRSFLPS
jgi:DNA oxidative demethylase